MNKRLYVGNLPYSVTETALREVFVTVGEVTAVSIITDRDTGRPKGFAFIDMANEELAQQAITQLNGHTMDDRTITVAEARPQAARDSYDSGGGRGGFGRGGGSGGRGGSRGGGSGGGGRRWG